MPSGCEVTLPPEKRLEFSVSSAATRLTSCVEFHLYNIFPFIITPIIFTNRMQSEGRGVKEIWGRKIINSQSRKMAINIYSFMKKCDKE
jgi:hypothetical protein